MVSKTKNTKEKFELESKEENDIQQTCCFNICRNLGLHDILSKMSAPAWYLCPKIPKKMEVEAKEENDIQQICYFNTCRNMGLHGILSKKFGPV